MSAMFESSDIQCGTGVSAVGVAPASRRCMSAPETAAAEVGPAPCSRPDLAAWSEQGGILPQHLADHIEHCPGCAERVRRSNEVHLALKLLCTETASPDLLARANGRALRFLRKAVRASAGAQRLLRLRPDLSLWQKAHLHLTRFSMGALAACLSLVVRAGLHAGFDHTRHVGEHLAAQHWERHIDPAGEWMAPRHSA